MAQYMLQSFVLLFKIAAHQCVTVSYCKSFSLDSVLCHHMRSHYAKNYVCSRIHTPVLTHAIVMQIAVDTISQTSTQVHRSHVVNRNHSEAPLMM